MLDMFIKIDYICVYMNVYVNRSPEVEVWQQKYNKPSLEAAAYSFVLQNLCILRGYLCKPYYLEHFWDRGFSYRNKYTVIHVIVETFSRQDLMFFSQGWLTADGVYSATMHYGKAISSN